MTKFVELSNVAMNKRRPIHKHYLPTYKIANQCLSLHTIKQFLTVDNNVHNRTAARNWLKYMYASEAKVDRREDRLGVLKSYLALMGSIKSNTSSCNSLNGDTWYTIVPDIITIYSHWYI